MSTNKKTDSAKCRYCKKDVEEGKMMPHLVKVHPNKLDERTCGICNKIFSSLHAMLDHQKTHKGSFPRCRSCPKAFVDKPTMSEHIGKFH